MRIERLDLTRFGHFTDHVLDFGAARTTGDLHVVYGANEAGKSTTLEALTDLLFGMPLRSPHNFLHEYKAMELGARVHQNGETLELRRFKNALADGAGNRLDGSAVDVHGLTREAFRARFSFDAAMLESGSEAMLASQGDLGEALFSASAGLPDIHARLDEAMAESDRFYEPRKTKDKLLPALLDELKAIEESIRSVDTQAGEWKRLRERAAELKARWDEGERALRAERGRQLARQRELAAFAARMRLGRDREALAALGELPDTPPEWLPRLRELHLRHTVLEDGLRSTRARRDELAARRDATRVDEALLARAERIDALAAQRSAERQRAARIVALDEEIADEERHVETARQDLDAPAGTTLDALLPSGERLRRLDALAGEHATLGSALASAREELRTLAARQASLLEADADAATPDPAPLAALLVHVRERAGAATLDVLERQARDSARELAAALDALAPWRGDAATLSALAVPSADARASARDALDAALGESRRLEAERVALDDTLLALERERVSLGVDERLDDAHATAARGRRDAAWRAHTDALDEENASPAARQRTARAFAEALAEDDAIGAERLRASDRLATLRGLDADLVEARARDEALSRSRVRADEALAGARGAIGAQATALGLDAAASAEDIERWLLARESALERHARHLGTLAELDAARARREALSKRLQDALSSLAPDTDGGPVPPSPLPDASLDERLAFADLRLRALEEAGERGRTRQAERQRVAAERQRRERTLRDSESDMADWRVRWQDALGDHWLGTRDAGAVVAMLPSLRALEKRLDARAQRKAERARLVAERARYLDEVRAALDPEATCVPPATVEASGEPATDEASPAPAPPRAVRVPDDPVETTEKGGTSMATDTAETAETAETAMVQLGALAARLDAARRVRDERERLVGEHREVVREVETLERELAPLSAELDAMRTPFGPSITLTELDAALDRTRERRRLVAEVADAERGLVEALGVESVDAALERLDALDRDTLEGDVEQLERVIAQKQEEVDERRLEARRAQDALDAVSGDAEAARLVERRANLLLEIRERAEETLRMRLGREAVLEGVRRYRDIHRGSMLSGARDAFVALTGGRYADLQTRPDDKGNDRLRAVDADGRSLETPQLSDGTRFQLYLALRIAAYHDYARHRTPLPFVADDVMESFDETRTGAAIGLLQRMAREGQVVYLTHHRRVVEIAREVTSGAVRVHELPDRS